MDALLGLGIRSAPKSTNRTCSSIEDLQGHLHNLIAAKSNETRAEHVSLSFEFGQNVVFYLYEEQESDSSAALEPPQQPQNPRVVNASETLFNQPSDDPILQRAVARHIISAIGVVDNSAYNVRELSRGAQGWTFTYLCKNSLQAWNRQHAKASEKLAIGAYSGPGGLNHIGMSRPAFDCRGTLTIEFSKSSRCIVIRYEHTPLHRTVGQLVDLLAPVTPPAPIANGHGHLNRSTKAKRPPQAEGEESAKKKRTRKSNGGGLHQVIDPSSGTQPQSEAPPTEHRLISDLHIPPEEAKRRKEVAATLLLGRGIDPTTLSEEQMNIFSNQAPQLQESSLEMLAKYGAERLRVVHPEEKEAVSATSTPQQGTPTGAITQPTPELVSTPTRQRRPNRKGESVAAVDGQAAPESSETVAANDGVRATTMLTLKPRRQRVTRGSCDTCKLKKVKCTKEHPQCQVCIDTGENCVYSPPKPRRKPEMSNEAVETEDSAVPGEGDQSQTEQEDTQQLSVSQVAQGAWAARGLQTAPPEATDPENDEFIPDPNILSGPIETETRSQQANTYYQSQDAGYSYPDPSSQRNRGGSGQNYLSQRQSQEGSMPALTYPQSTASRSTATANIARHSLPTTQSAQPQIEEPPNASWANSAQPPAPASQPRDSPTLAQQLPKQPRSRRSAFGPDSTQQSSQVRAPTSSPYQGFSQKATARAKSRAGQRPQTQIPTTQTPIPPPQVPTVRPSPTMTSSTLYNTTSTASSSSSAPTLDPYGHHGTSSKDQYSSASNDPSSNRAVPYGSTSTALNAYSTPAFDYTRSAGTTNPLSHALNSYNPTSANGDRQWSATQSHSSQPTSMPSITSNPYDPSPDAQATSAHHSPYGTRSASRQQSSQSTSSYPPRQQQQTYRSSTYAQQQGSSQQHDQNWYGLGSSNAATTNSANYGGNSRASGYGGAPSSQPTSYTNTNGYGHESYGGSNGSTMYNSLRASGSGH